MRFRLGTMDFWIATDAKLTDPTVLSSLFGALAELIPDAFPTRWGDVEPFRIRASAIDYQDVIAFASTRTHWPMGLIPKSDTIMSISPGNDGHEILGTVSIKIDIRAMSENLSDNRRRIAALFERWVQILDAHFGRCSRDEERWRKNVIEMYREADGIITNPKVFDCDMRRGLPGVYWTTYFGREYVDWLGESRVSSAPWPMVKKCGDGYLLRRSDNPNTWEAEAELDSRVIEHLGRVRFFDIADPFRRLELLPRYEEFRRAKEVAANAHALAEANGATDVSSKHDIERLLADSMPFVQQLLAKYGEFFPVGLALTPAGEISHVAVADADDRSAKSVYEELASILRDGLTGRRYRAFAILSNVVVPRPRQEVLVDAVRAQCEHESGYGVTIYTPYSVRAEGAVKFDESWAV